MNEEVKLTVTDEQIRQQEIDNFVAKCDGEKEKLAKAVDVLYSPDERRKLEWAIDAINMPESARRYWASKNVPVVIADSDIVESDFIYRDFRCICALRPHGHRCGYVCIPEGELYHEMDYDDIPISCHGGLTYAGHLIPGVMVESMDWWIGFDCAHLYDGPETARNRLSYVDSMADDELLYKTAGHMKPTIKTKEYVSEQLRLIVDQLIENKQERIDSHE